MAGVVAVLFLNFVDEQFNDARYTQALVSIAVHIAHGNG